MMNCDLWQDKIDGFVDCELEGEEARDFEQHLRLCPACSAETLSRQRMKVQTRFAGQSFMPSAQFEKRIKRMAASRRPRWIVTWVPVSAGAAALLVIALTIGLAWRSNFMDEQLVSQLVDQHVAMLASNNPVDVISNDQHTVRPWLAGKVPFSVKLPQLAGTPFTLVGARVSYVRQVPAAQLVFAYRRHRISVFVFKDNGEMTAAGDLKAAVPRKGFATETWVEDGLRYFAISDAEAQYVHQLCDLLKQPDRS